jgi:GNAT superfamily N-acetyltransferase
MATTNVHITPAGTSSIPVLIEMMRQYWQFEQIRGFDADNAGRMLQEFFSRPEFGRGWIAFNDQQVLGYLLCSCVFSFEFGGLTAAIDELYVIAPARGQGVGKLLVQSAEAQMRDMGCMHIEMEVAEKNFRAQQFYSLLGFASRTGYAMMHKKL